MTWTFPTLIGDENPARSAFCMQEIDNKIIMYGGTTKEWESGEKCFDVWLIDPEKLTVKKCSTTYVLWKS